MEHPISPFCTEFGRRVARRRRILNLTQQAVGERIGLQRAHISQLEQGKYRSMQLERLAALAGVLETSTDYLLQRVLDDPWTIPPRPRPGAALSLDGMPLPLTTTTPLAKDNDCHEYSAQPVPAKLRKPDR